MLPIQPYYTPILENQMDKNMEHEMETREYLPYYTIVDSMLFSIIPMTPSLGLPYLMNHHRGRTLIRLQQTQTCHHHRRCYSYQPPQQKASSEVAALELSACLSAWRLEPGQHIPTGLFPRIWGRCPSVLMTLSLSQR